jgi:uncharacterized membrane-anchored protein
MGEESKSPLASKTLWINFIMTAAAFIPAVNAIMTPEIAGAIFGAVNMALRFLTTKPIVKQK